MRSMYAFFRTALMATFLLATLSSAGPVSNSAPAPTTSSDEHRLDVRQSPGNAASPAAPVDTALVEATEKADAAQVAGSGDGDDGSDDSDNGSYASDDGIDDDGDDDDGTDDEDDDGDADADADDSGADDGGCCGV